MRSGLAKGLRWGAMATTTSLLIAVAAGQQLEDGSEMTIHDLFGSHPTCLNDETQDDPFNDETRRTITAVLQANARLSGGGEQLPFASARFVLQCKSFGRCRNHVALGFVVLDRWELDRIQPVPFRLDSETEGQETTVSIRIDSEEPWGFRWLWHEYGERHGEARSLWTVRHSTGGFSALSCEHFDGVVRQVANGDRVIAQVGGSSVFVFHVGEKRRPVSTTGWGPTEVCLREFWERCKTLRLQADP